jgi:hypothetical protein
VLNSPNRGLDLDCGGNNKGEAVCDASSGMKGQPANDRSTIDIAAAPAASPRTKAVAEFLSDFSITNMS